MDIGGPIYVCMKAGNTVEVPITWSRIGSRATMREHQEVDTIEVSIFRSAIDSRPMYVTINLSGLVKLVGWDTL